MASYTSLHFPTLVSTTLYCCSTLYNCTKLVPFALNLKICSSSILITLVKSYQLTPIICYMFCYIRGSFNSFTPVIPLSVYLFCTHSLPNNHPSTIASNHKIKHIIQQRKYVATEKDYSFTMQTNLFKTFRYIPGLQLLQLIVWTK